MFVLDILGAVVGQCGPIFACFFLLVLHTGIFSPMALQAAGFVEFISSSLLVDRLFDMKGADSKIWVQSLNGCIGVSIGLH